MNAQSGRGPIISIFGSYSPKPGEPLYELAYRLGSALAGAGYVVCNGGYDGTMEASAKGAKDAGGATVGVTCCVFNDYRGVPLKANRWIDREICAENIFTRIETMMRMSAGFVVLEGGTGTLSEFGIVWEYVCKGLMEPRPIFVVGEFWRPLIERIRSVRAKSCKNVYCVNDTEEVVRIAGEMIGPGDRAHFRPAPTQRRR